MRKPMVGTVCIFTWPKQTTWKWWGSILMNDTCHSCCNGAPGIYSNITNPHTFVSWIPSFVLESFSDVWEREGLWWSCCTKADVEAVGSQYSLVEVSWRWYSPEARLRWVDSGQETPLWEWRSRQNEEAANSSCINSPVVIQTTRATSPTEGHCVRLSWGDMNKCLPTLDMAAMTDQSNSYIGVQPDDPLSLRLRIGMWMRGYLKEPGWFKDSCITGSPLLTHKKW